MSVVPVCAAPWLPVPDDGPSVGTFSTEEIEALRRLKHELGRQAESLTEARAALNAREEFIERSEAALMEKLQAQQVHEVELEQREENLSAGMRRACVLSATNGGHEPAGAVA